MKFVFIDQDISRDYIDVNNIISPLKKLGDVHYFDDKLCSQDELYRRAKDADVIIFSINQLSNHLICRLAKNQRLKHIQFMGIGYQNYVDSSMCNKFQISVSGVGEYGSNAIAEYTLGLILTLIRGIVTGDRRMKKHEWNMMGLLGSEIAGATIGIVGTGAIGRVLAQKLFLLGAKIIAYDIREDPLLIKMCKVKYVTLEELMSVSDIVSVHLRYSSDTAKIISSKMLAKMKPSSVLVNTARAQVIDYDALTQILKNNYIRAAAIDVHNEEPLNEWDLVDLENVIATPHIAYYTDVANTNLLRKSVESVLKNISCNQNVGMI